MRISRQALPIFFAAGAGTSRGSNEYALLRLMEKMEDDVRELSREVERAYAHRCGSALYGCRGSNYDSWLSAYPDQTCPGGDQLFGIPECGDGVTCGGLFDFTVSSVDLPWDVADGPDGNPTDPMVIETVCYTRQLEEWFRKKYEDDLEYWAKYDIDSPWMYFGSIDGTFRIFPARRSKNPGEYDPKLRPWYIAGSSGPTDLLLVLDTSGSMDGYTLDLLKRAAKRIVRTLTVGDRVAIVQFNDEAEIIGDTNFLIPATKENKEKLLAEIDQLRAGGKTNFYDAISLAFSAYNKTLEKELNTGCNAALLFFTDGEMTHPTSVTEQDVIDLFVSKKAAVEERIKRPLTIFTYSIGDEDVHTLPRRIACETDGLWTRIDDEEELVDRMSGYYKLFSAGLGEGKNDDFVAWVEPYEFATGSKMGTTVSKPVYDHSVDPPLFLGVVGIDFTLDAMEQAYEAGSEETLRQVVRRSTARCPDLSFGPCQFESLRRQAGGDEALCAKNCTSFVGIEPEQCPSVSDYPRYLWANTDNEGKSFEDCVCCLVGTNEPSGRCPATPEQAGASKPSLPTGAIVGIVVGAVFVVIFLYYFFCRWW